MKSSKVPSLFVAALLAAAPLTFLAAAPCPDSGSAAPDMGMSGSSDKPSTHPQPTAPLPSASRSSGDSTSATGASASGSSSAPTHKKCPYSTQECLNYMAQRLKSAGWIGIEYDGDQPGYPKIQKVVPGSPAEKAGLEAGDELITLNGVDIKESSEEKIKEARGDYTPGHTVHYVVKRKGKLKPVDITLGTWPADLLARYIGEHMLEHAEADAQALAAAPKAP